MPVANFFLWFLSLVFGILFFFIPLYFDLVNGTSVNMNGINALLMTASKISFLLAFSLLLAFMFIGNDSIYFQIFGNKFTQSIRKLLFGAFLVSPIMAKASLALQDRPPTALTYSSGYLLYVGNIVSSFIVSLFLYLSIECPIGDILRLLITDIIRLVHKAVDSSK